MVQFLLMTAVLASIYASEHAPRLPVSDAAWRLLLAAAGMFLVVAVAQATSWRFARQIRNNPAQQTSLLRRFNRFRAIHGVLWLAMVGATLYGLRWTQLVRCNWQLNDTLLLRDVLVLLPAILPLVASWAAFYQVDRSLCLAACAEPHSLLTAPIGLGRYLLLHVRHSLGLVLLPVLIVLAVQDLAHWIAPRTIGGEAASLIALVPLLLMFALFPLALARVWSTQPLENGPLRQNLEHIAAQWNLRPREILVWRTDRTVLNAAVAGFFPQLRYVFLSDRLLASFHDDEIAAVFLHEIGHIRHHHLALRLMMMLVPAGLWLAVRDGLAPWLGQGHSLLAGAGLSDATQAMILAPLGLAIFAGTLFARFSRLLECEADMFACRDPLSASGGKPALGPICHQRAASTSPCSTSSASPPVRIRRRAPGCIPASTSESPSCAACSTIPAPPIGSAGGSNAFTGSWAAYCWPRASCWRQRAPGNANPAVPVALPLAPLARHGRRAHRPRFHARNPWPSGRRGRFLGISGKPAGFCPKFPAIRPGPGRKCLPTPAGMSMFRAFDVQSQACYRPA